MNEFSGLSGAGLVTTACLLLPLTTLAAPDDTSAERSRPATSVETAFVERPDVDLDANGAFDHRRLAARASHRVPLDRAGSVSLVVDYEHDDYDFADGGLAGVSPWSDVATLSVSAPIRWRLGKRSSAILTPRIESSAETGAGRGHATTVGGFGGVAYRMSERLTLGPGIVVATRIEDDAQVFPILFVRWAVTDEISIETGRGGSTAVGPGVNLRWRPSGAWALSLGASFERLRFRLDDEGATPGGVGEDESTALVGAIHYDLARHVRLDLLTGAAVGGELRVEDARGQLVLNEDYDPAGFAGVTLSAAF